MPKEPEKTDFPYDFFVSRRGVAAEVAKEVADVLDSAGHKVLVQDFDIPFSANFVAAMHDAVKTARHLVALLTEDYDVSPFTRAEWTSFFAAATPTGGKRRLAILRVDNVAPPGLLAPIVYGDLFNVTDREKRREIILAAAEGRSIGKRRGNQVFNGIPPRNPDFTGRTELLSALHLTLSADELPTAIIQATQAAIYGLGGVGKTSLATEYAYLHADDYAGVWWAAAENRTILITSLAELAGVLDSKFGNEMNTERAAKAGLSALANHERPWLLIYDNVPIPDEIRDLRPTKGARLIITTRHPDWGSQASELEIDVLEHSDAVNFLLKRTHRVDKDGAGQLAETLGYLPLALDHAGAYVVSAGIGFNEYAKRYLDLIANAPRGNVSAVATFNLAIERAIASCHKAETLLAFFSVLASERIPLDLLDKSFLSERERDDAMIALFSVSLIKNDPFSNGSLAVSVHRLVRAAMRTRALTRRKIKEVLTVATAQLVAAFPKNMEDEPGVWPRCEQLLPHMLALSRDPDNRSKYTIYLMGAAAQFLFARGAYRQSEKLSREALTIAEQLVGSKHPIAATAQSLLARAALELGNISEAEILIKSAIKAYTRKHNRKDEMLASMLTTFGNILMNDGRAYEAKSKCLDVLAISRKLHGAKRSFLIGPLGNIAVALVELEEFSEAERYLREAISIVRSISDTDHTVRRHFNNFAELLRRMGHHLEAEELARRAVANGQASLGKDHPDCAISLTTLAKILRDMKRYDEAEPLLLEATKILTEVLGPKHSDVGFARAVYSTVLIPLGREKDAHNELSEAYSIHEQSATERHSWRLSYGRELSAAFDLAGRDNDATAIRSRYRIK